jgi:hypothetical protein
MGVASLVALVAVVAGAFGPLGLTLTVAFVLVAAFGIGWPQYLGVPAAKTLGAIIALAGAGGAIAAAYTGAPGYLRWLPVPLALGVAAVFVVQLLRGTGQSHRLESTLGASTGVVISCLGAGWIAAQRFLVADRQLLLVTGVSAAVALGIGLIRWPDRIVAPLAILFGALAGPLAALLLTDVHLLPAAVVGAAVAAVLASFRSLAVAGGPRRSVPAGAAMGIAPILALGALVYFIDKLLIT